MTALTIPELAAICLGPNKSPWPLKDLLGLYKVKTLSLRSLVEKVSEAKAIYYVQVRDLELLEGVSTVAGLKGKWAAAVPSRATLIALNKTLNSAGAIDRLHFLRLEDGRDLRKFCLPCEHLRKERRRSAFDGSGDRYQLYLERSQRRSGSRGGNRCFGVDSPNRRRRCLSASAQESSLPALS